jgi:hypothetical protein
MYYCNIFSILIFAHLFVGIFPANHIQLVSVGSQNVTIVGVIEDWIQSNPKVGALVELYELGSELMTKPWTQRTPLTSSQLTSTKTFTFKIPRFTDFGHDLLYSAYVVTVRNLDNSTAYAVTKPRYADQLEFPARYNFPFPHVYDIKGLQVQIVDDAIALGVQHAAINVPLDAIMLKKELAPENTIRFQSNGRTFFFDKTQVTKLDHQIKPLSDAGQLVNLILLVYNESNPNSASDILRHPDADSSGIVLGFNTVTAEGVAYLTAAFEFVADRYMREDRAYGRAVGYIVGNEVDSQWIWSNSGEKTLSEFMDCYSRAVRLASQTTRKMYAEARTYISLDHQWTQPYQNNKERYYSGRDVVDLMNNITKESGDFGWNIAFHPYPHDLGNPAFWNDTNVNTSFNTHEITFKNLEVLPAYVAQPSMSYAGKTRRIILSEQGCHTVANKTGAEELQAACFAFAYYKIRFLNGIDSFVYFSHVDSAIQGDLKLGLLDPKNQPKHIHEVYRHIDTKLSLNVTEFAKSIIGIVEWKDVIPGFDPTKLPQRPVK